MTIGIIGAMNCELDYFKNKLMHRKTIKKNGFSFEVGTLYNKKLVIAKAGIGKINAALCAEVLMMTFKPDMLINTGVAGALSPDLHIKDFVISTGFVEYDMDTSPIGDPVGLMILGEEQRTELPCMPSLVDYAVAIFEKAQVPYMKGIIATGDRFIGTREAKEEVMQIAPNAICCEMEGVAIAHAAYMAKTPYITFRAISDTADDTAEMNYAEFVREAGKTSQEVVTLFLKKLTGGRLKKILQP